MKIAIMAPLVTAIREPQLGGSQAFVADLARGLAGRGHEVHVYAASGSRIEGVEVIDTGVDPRALAGTLYRAFGSADSSARRAEAAFATAFAAVRSSRYDVIHNHAFDAPASGSRPDCGHPWCTRSTCPRTRPCRRLFARRPGQAARRHSWPSCQGPRRRLGARSCRSTRCCRRTRPRVTSPGPRPPAMARCSRAAEPGEGRGRGHRHRPNGRCANPCLRRRLRRAVHQGADRSATRLARRGCTRGGAPGRAVAGYGSGGRRVVPRPLG